MYRVLHRVSGLPGYPVLYWGNPKKTELQWTDDPFNAQKFRKLDKALEICEVYADRDSNVFYFAEWEGERSCNGQKARSNYMPHSIEKI